MVKTLLKFSLFLLLFLISLNLPKISLANTVLFSDDFNDGDAEGWSVPRDRCSTDWQVNNFSYGIIINSACITETIPDSLTIPDDAIYSFEVDMSMPVSSNMDRNFVFKYLNSTNWYGIHTIGSHVYLHKVVNGTEYFLTNWDTIYPFVTNQTYHFKVIVKPSGFDVYINGLLHTSVPESGVTFLSNKAGLQASSGGMPDSQVWFDNVVITLIDSGTPIPTPSPISTPSPTPVPTIGPFELPFNYPGRPATNSSNFKSGFWGRLTATFDHTFPTGIHRPFTGNSYFPADITNCSTGIGCYDSHNGTDFSRSGGQEVYSVSEGSVVFTSEHDSSTCTPNKGGFGCVVIVYYPESSVYGLFAHLDKIFVDLGQSVNSSSVIAEMGQTGCPGCGEHLHFGVLKPTSVISAITARLINKKGWQELIYNIKPDIGTKYKPFCTYKAPNGTSFSLQDPSGWAGEGVDPWSLPLKKGGCGVNSHYLWKFDIGSTP